MNAMDERTKLYSDTIITAVEGGTGYWASVSNYNWSADDTEPARVTLHEIDEGGTFDVTWPAIAGAMYRIVYDQRVRVRDTIRESIQRALAAPEDADLDADDADVIVQVAVFGEIVYG